VDQPQNESNETLQQVHEEFSKAVIYELLTASLNKPQANKHVNLFLTQQPCPLRLCLND
jgi:hypothetical protein